MSFVNSVSNWECSQCKNQKLIISETIKSGVSPIGNHVKKRVIRYSCTDCNFSEEQLRSVWLDDILYTTD